MASGTRKVRPSLGELVDRLAIDQFKQLHRPEIYGSVAEEVARIEQYLDAMFTQSGGTLDAQHVRLVIALAQVNVHIWHAKEMMLRSPVRFKECMKLAHQLNGIRNQIKNRLTALSAGHAGPIPSNTSTEDLKGWRFSVLECGKGT